MAWPFSLGGQTGDRMDFRQLRNILAIVEPGGMGQAVQKLA